MKISVIIPAYNEEKYIGKCLESLTHQQEKADEIIIVDNNCTDQTLQIVKRFPVKVVREEVQGMIQARNRGFNEAQCEIIARIDADTIVPPNWIKKIKENFENSPIDALTGPIIFHDLIATTFFARLYLAFMKIIQKGKETLAGPNMVITKKIWQKVKGEVCLDGRAVHEDIDLGIHINKAGGLIKRDNTLIINISGRRIKNDPLSFFIEYPIRMFKTILKH